MIGISLALIVGMMLPAIVFGEFQPGQKRTIAAGEELKVKGIIMSRDGETFVMRDLARVETVVVLTEATSIQTARKGLGLIRKSKSFDVTALLPGLILQVEGVGDSQDRLVADKIRFKEEDLKAALTAYAQTVPVGDKTDKALREIAETDKRISSLDDYEVVNVVKVLFAVNKSDLSAEAKADLDALAAKAPSAKNYTVEVQGFADKTGNFNKNLQLSQRRADAVVQYLAVKHSIPLRRITTPMGYGSTKSVADESTAEGRAENRRVEVRILVNKGLNQ
jgi:outer membrane protein OmpA-like peptidoglycan-associated protein